MPPDLYYESEYAGIVAGVDEAGRGPWAGPVVAAAVILDCANVPKGIHDSKQLTREKRERLFDLICACAQYGIGEASVAEIDAMNILQATRLAMARAVAALPFPPAMALVDGNQPPDLSCAVTCIVKGDSKSLSIAAASILAKVTRDRYMRELARIHPEYGFERHAGYGTRYHQEALARYGVTPHHRKSFAPIRNVILSKAKDPLTADSSLPLGMSASL